MDFPDLAGRLADARERIGAAAHRAGRDPGGVTIVAVTKTHPVTAMLEALDQGLVDLGESRVQEALPKLDRVAGTVARVHLIGQLQTNKVNKAVGRFASIMSVDRPELLEKIARRADDLEVVQPVWIQVNTSGEEQKAGCAPGAADELVAEAASSDRLELRGLMTMGALEASESDLRRGFAELRGLRDRLCPGSGLSMGMSGDFELAVEEGATCVRLGTTLFGPRPVPA